MEAGQFLAVAGKYIRKLFLAALFFSCAGCVSFVRVDGPYEGWVIDAVTKKPVEGVVVHGDWYKVWGTVGGASSKWYDSAETLTDRNGAFKIPGKGLLLLSNLDELHLTIFKAGYKQWPPNSWSGLKGQWPNDEVAWEGDRPTFRLKGLSMEERRKSFVTMPVGVSGKKLDLMKRESNKENIELGLPSDTLYTLE
ncbi:hypothetical protein [Geomonas azotofigens]|uniref:hypothetical protein n=1 Tax=Geomonas azotofigens TaxID=2843196 RepID=UPI001C102046|nr:hypothetical protein [Geomonas azotofigens]MBU5613525.1 hypothetical protein [Geomonas azotofigens]